MKDYIKIPTWINLSLIRSNILDSYLNKENLIIEEKHYVSNINNEKSLIRELELRGFSYKINSIEKNFTSSTPFFKMLIIYTDQNTNKFKNIDYHELGLPNLNKEFNIKSDKFFNFIPIDNFNKINPKLNIQALVREFSSKGFLISTIEELTSSKLENIDNFIVVNKRQLEHLKIEDVFYESEFIVFKDYFLGLEITRISDLKQKRLNQYFISYPEQRKLIESRLGLLIELIDQYGENQEYRNKTLDLGLFKIFYEEDFMLFLVFLQEKGIYDLRAYSMEVLEKDLAKYELQPLDKIKARTDLIYKILNLGYKSKSTYQDLKISQVLKSKKYEKLIEVLSEENIFYFNELLKENIVELLEGSYIRQDVKEEFGLLLDSYKIIYEIFLKKDLLRKEDSLELLIAFNNIKIRDLFSFGTGKVVYRYFNKIGKTYIEELELKDFNGLKKYYGIGEVKITYAENVLASYNNIKVGILGNKNLKLINKYFGLNAIYRIEDLKDGYELLLENIDVDTVFIEGKYSLILEYFKENNIEKINDISNKDIINIKNKKGIGEKKFTDFLNKLTNFIETEISGFNLENYKKQITIYSGIKINKGLGYLDLAKIKNDYLIADLKKLDFKKFSKEEQTNILILLKYLHEFKGLNKILQDSLKKFSKRDLYILYMRNVEDLTLQDVGENLNLSRERVRQLEASMLDNINIKLKKNNFHIYLKFIFNTDTCFDIDLLNQKLRRENRFLTKLIKKGYIEELYYFKQIEKVYFYPVNREKDKLDKFIANLPDINTKEYYLEELEKFIYNKLKLDLSVEELLRVFENYGFHWNKNYLSRNKLHYSDMIYILFKDILKEPLRVDHHSQDYINNLILRHFGVDKKKDERNIRAILDRFEDILLYDSKTYSYVGNLKNNLKLMYRIKDFIDKYLEDNSIINTEYIFKNFKEECLKAGIDNKIYLYSLIKYNFGDIYSIGQGNTLSIKSLDKEEHITKEEVLLEVIAKSQENKVEKSYVIKKLGWNKVNLENTLVKCRRVISFENDYIADVKQLFQGGEKEFVEKLVEEEMKELYSTTYIIYNKLDSHPIGRQFLTRNGIREHSTLSNILKKIDPNIIGHINLIYYENSQVKGIEDLIKIYMDGVCKREDIQNYLYSKGYKSGMIGLHLKNMIKEGKLKEISPNELIKSEDLKIDKYILEELKSVIKREMGDRNFIGLTEAKIQKLKAYLPKIKYRWTSHLIRSILVGNGFKRLERRNCDYRYELVILVKDNFSGETYEDLVIELLKNDYKGSFNENEIYDYLVELDLIEESDNRDKKLPYEIESSPLFKIDNNGKVYI